MAASVLTFTILSMILLAFLMYDKYEGFILLVTPKRRKYDKFDTEYQRLKQRRATGQKNTYS